MGKEIVIVSFGGPFYLKIPLWDYPNNNLFEVSCARPQVLSLRFFFTNLIPGLVCRRKPGYFGSEAREVWKVTQGCGPPLASRSDAVTQDGLEGTGGVHCL